MSKGWSSVGLKAVGDDENLWTVADAARLLGPPDLSEDFLRRLVHQTRMEPVGKRKTTINGRSGRYARVYRASDFIHVYETLSRLQ